MRWAADRNLVNPAFGERKGAISVAQASGAHLPWATISLRTSTTSSGRGNVVCRNDHARHKFGVGHAQHRIDDLLRRTNRVPRGETLERLERSRRVQWSVDEGRRHDIDLHVMRGKFDGE